jgi:hypothetical protein
MELIIWNEIRVFDYGAYGSSSSSGGSALHDKGTAWRKLDLFCLCERRRN